MARQTFCGLAIRHRHNLRLESTGGQRADQFASPTFAHRGNSYDKDSAGLDEQLTQHRSGARNQAILDTRLIGPGLDVDGNLRHAFSIIA